MSGTLLVPVKLDALLLAEDTAVVEAAADFTQLAWTDPTRDHNPDVAYLSENIVSRPFENQDLFLKPGVHLHWALPDTLTHATQTAGATDFPAVPNRWLVVRSRGGVTESARIVESDYLYPDGEGADSGAISVPVDADPAAGKHRPYRYQGRTVPLDLWAEDAAADRVSPLTAVGYGETNFASLYPNCRGVFGMHDPIAASQAAGARYDLLGWYSDAASDRLYTFVQGYTVDVDPDDPGQGTRAPTPDELQAAVADELGWSAPTGLAEFPDRVLCYARLEFAADAQPVEDAASEGAVEVAIASSGVEALSAYLASRVGSADDKATLEDQLESLQLLPRLAHRALDVGANLDEGRHERSFASLRGGTAWSVRGESATPAAADAQQGQARAEISLPAELAAQLNAVNGLQEAWDEACDAVVSLRQRVFGDWYRYLLCAYPPPDSDDDYPDVDEARHFIEAKSLTELQRAIADTGTLALAWEDDGRLKSAAGSAAGSRAAALADAVGALLGQVAALNAREDVVAAGLTYAMRDTPGPVWWQPRDPVVLLSGPSTRGTERHGGDGVLECDVVAGTPEELVPAGVADVLDALTKVQEARGADAFGFSTWTAQPWNPLILEWEVEVLPVAAGSNLDPDAPDYAEDFLTAGFTLALEDPDLSLRPGQGALSKAANVYTGSSLLTAAAPEVLATRLDEYLDDESTDLTTQVAQDLAEARDLLKSPDFHALSQSLGGFHEALLMRRQTLQLPIADPLGWGEDADFAAAVAAAVADENRSASQPLWDFNPVRTGALRLLGLRLVDTFGRVRELDVSRPVTTELLKTAEDPTLVWLPPRLVPPARLELRWLSAADGREEIGDVPLETPVCGWFVPNNLDGSLQVYDAAGAALGLIDLRGHWEAPGAGMLADPGGIANPHLKRAVGWLLAKGEDFLSPFLDTVDSALENIDPESAAQHADLALLMGRPFALARCTLGLEIQGPPPVHQGWTHFGQDLQRTARDTDALERVRVPLRVGEHAQLNDGVVGYWVEDADGAYGSAFYAPQSDAPRHADIVTGADDPAPLSRCLDEPPLTLGLLFDPRGVVHATSGVVPVQELSIPPARYADALAAIEVIFLATPLLTQAGALNVPLPSEPGFAWSWLGDEGAALGRALPTATFAAQEVREGWLRLTPDSDSGGSPDAA